MVPFLRIGDAFAAVCASGSEERGLGGVEVTWAGASGSGKTKSTLDGDGKVEGGKRTEGWEPEILGWLRRRGELGSKKAKETTKPDSVGEKGEEGGGGNLKAELPQSKTRPQNAAVYSSFPSSFVRPLPSHPQPSFI